MQRHILNVSVSPGKNLLSWAQLIEQVPIVTKLIDLEYIFCVGYVL
jgi:hypothetical protein